jgi:hypothetical protein
LQKHNVGTTEELSVEPLDTGDGETGQEEAIVRTVKIFPDLGLLSGILSVARYAYYGNEDPIYYVTTQCKATRPGDDGTYKMSFENDVYKVETLKSPGVITLRPAATDELELFREELTQSAISGDEDARRRLASLQEDHVHVMETHITVTTHFAAWMVGVHSIFMKLVRIQTDQVFRMMLDSMYPYLRDTAASSALAAQNGMADS